MSEETENKGRSTGKARGHRGVKGAIVAIVAFCCALGVGTAFAGGISAQTGTDTPGTDAHALAADAPATIADEDATTTITMNLAGVEGDLQPTLNLHVYEGASVTVDWGDDTQATVTESGNQSITKASPYAVAQQYDITITSDFSEGPAYLLGQGSSSTSLLGSTYCPYLVSVKTAANAGVQKSSFYGQYSSALHASLFTSADLSSCNTSEVADISYLFYGCSSLAYLDLSGLDTKNVTNMSYMFYECDQLSKIDLSQFDTAQVTNMRYMFYGCESLAELEVSGFQTAGVTDMADMFCSCTSLTELDLSAWNVEEVTTMTSMFNSCNALSNLKITGWNTKSLTTMANMFGLCSALTELDLSGFDTENVTGMYGAFYFCSALTELDVSGFDTGKVTDMSSMFYGCSVLTILDLSDWNTSAVTDMSHLFQDCRSLRTLDLSSFDTATASSTRTGMFSGCTGLYRVVLGEEFSVTPSINPLPTPAFTEPYVASGMWQSLQADETLSSEHYSPSEIAKSAGADEIVYYASIQDLQQGWFSCASEVTYTGSSIALPIEQAAAAPADLDADDYTVTCFDPTGAEVGALEDPGTYTIVVTGTGDVLSLTGYYGGSVTYEVSVLVELATSMFTVDVNDHTYTGTAIEPSVSSTLQAENYTVAYSNNLNVGEATINITGVGAYTGELTYTFQIVTATLDRSMFTVDTADKTYSGAAFTPSVTSSTLQSGDYTVAYENNIEVGTAQIVITGQGNCEGTVTFTFQIVPIALAESMFTVDVSEHTYTGTAIEPRVKSNLTEDTDYTVEYKDNVDAGTASIIISGTGHYAGGLTYNFTILGIELNTSMFTVDVADQTYTGSAIEPKVRSSLTAGTDYTVVYSDNVAVGTGKITITGAGNYAGVLTYTFAIVAAPDTGNPDTGNPDTGNPDTGNPDTETEPGPVVTNPDSGTTGTGGNGGGKTSGSKLTKQTIKCKSKVTLKKGKKIKIKVKGVKTTLCWKANKKAQKALKIKSSTKKLTLKPLKKAKKGKTYKIKIWGGVGNNYAKSNVITIKVKVK